MCSSRPTTPLPQELRGGQVWVPTSHPAPMHRVWVSTQVCVLTQNEVSSDGVSAGAAWRRFSQLRRVNPAATPQPQQPRLADTGSCLLGSLARAPHPEQGPTRQMQAPADLSTVTGGLAGARPSHGHLGLRVLSLGLIRAD